MSNPASGPDSLGASGGFYRYDSLALLETAFTSGELKGKMTREIKTGSDGTIIVTRATDGEDVTWPFTAGNPEPIQITGITASGSTLSPSSTLPVKVYL